MDAALHFLASRYGKQLVYVTIEAHDADERTARLLIRKVKSDFGQLQRRAGYPRYNVEILEGEYRVHSHIVAPLPLSDAKRLLDYAYGSHVDVKLVYDLNGLRDNYLLKEATPQAAYRQSIRRRKGSHRLGDGGGDRVRLSRDLSAALERKGAVQRHKRTYASRVISKPKIASTAFSKVPSAIPPLAAEQPESVETNIQLALPLDAPIFPLGERLEAKRREVGLSQRDLARRLGVRQAHYSNSVIRHHDRLSGPVLRRALEWLTVATDVTRQ